MLVKTVAIMLGRCICVLMFGGHFINLDSGTRYARVSVIAAEDAFAGKTKITVNTPDDGPVSLKSSDPLGPGNIICLKTGKGYFSPEPSYSIAAIDKCKLPVSRTIVKSGTAKVERGSNGRSRTITVGNGDSFRNKTIKVQ
jgi:hypothetical protein